MMLANRGLRHRTALLLLLLALTICEPHIAASHASDVTAQLVLYAHTDPSATSVDGRVLSLSSNATSKQAVNIEDGLDFTLFPPLSATLHLMGGIDLYVWLTSPQGARGTLEASLSEISLNATVIEIRSISVTIAVPSNPYQVIFGLGSVDHTVEAGSALRLRVQFLPQPGNPVPVLLLWDDPATATRLVFLKVDYAPKISLTVTDAQGRISTVFPENETGLVRLEILASIEDPFRGTNVRTVALNVTDSSGNILYMTVPMRLTSQVEQPFRLGYSLPVTVPSGDFTITALVSDSTGRTFNATKEVTVTKFHTIEVVVVDGQDRPLPNLNISISSGEGLVDDIITDSTGSATARVPAGPLVMQIVGDWALNFSRIVESSTDTTVKLAIPWYDWDIVARLQGTTLPVSAANVQLYLNGTLVRSRETEANGTARFVSIPPGSYEVMISSWLGSKRFFNVTHLPKPSETVLELPVLSGIPPVTIVVFAAATIFAVIVAAARRYLRKQVGAVRHVADLLGGAVPQSSVVMIVGPSGSGKSLLLQNMLVDQLQLDRRCVYASNAELPSSIRDALSRMGVKAATYEKRNALRFIDAYSGETSALSAEKHSVGSPKDLTGLGIQLTTCIEELGGKADVFLDSLAPIVSSGEFEHALEFVRYYGARTTKSGGTLLYVATTNMEPRLLNQLEEASDCVLQIEKSEGTGKTIGRLLIKKARGIEHTRGWLELKVDSKGHIEFVPSSDEKQ